MTTITYRTQKLNIRRGFTLTLTVGYAMAALVPLYTMVSLASRPADSDLSGLAPPQGALWSNMSTLLADDTFMRYLFNSTVVTLVACLLDVILSAMAGYALARLRFPGRRALMNMVIAALSLSPIIVAIPVYIAFAKIGWLDSYRALIIPIAVSALGVFLVRQYALSIPNPTFSAARIDGASEVRIFLRIALPLLRPALLTVFLLQFLLHWDSLFWPLIAVSSQDLWTLPIGLNSFEGQYGIIYYLLMSAAILSALPPLLLLILLQRYYVAGLTTGGVKR